MDIKVYALLAFALFASSSGFDDEENEVYGFNYDYEGEGGKCKCGMERETDGKKGLNMKKRNSYHSFKNG